MKPNFALSLSFEGIRLLHRSGTGWTLVGEVALDSPDLAGELAVLRKTAVALDPAGLRSKIILPNDQIRYLALDTTRATEDDIRAAVVAATPYAAEEMAWDHVRGGGRTYIAAVARDTLAEAETFAADHRFGPVSFVAIPEDFTFVGEPFFGQTKVAATLLPPGETVERDPVAVRIGPAPRPTPLPTFLKPAAPAEPLTPVPTAVEQDTAETAAKAPDETPSLQTGDAQASEPVPAANAAENTTDPDPVPDAEALTLPESPDSGVVVADDVTPTESETPPAATVPDAPETEIRTEAPKTATTAAPLAPDASSETAAPAQPEPQPAEAAAPSAATAPEPPAAPPAAAETPSPDNDTSSKAAPPASSGDATQSDDADAPAPVFSSRARPQRALAADPVNRTPPPPPSAIPAATTGEPVFARRAPPPAAATAVPTPAPAVAPVAVTETAARAAQTADRAGTSTGRISIDTVVPVARTEPTSPRITGVALGGAARPTVVPFAPPRPTAAPAPEADSRIAVFPQRTKPPAPATIPAKPEAKLAAAARTPGKPRFLGLIMTAILVVLMLIVALWLGRTDNVVSRLFGIGTPDPAEVAAAVPVAVPLVLPSDTVPAAAPDIAAPESAALAPATADPVLPQDPAPLPEDGGELIAADPVPDMADPADRAAPPDAVAAAAAAALLADAIIAAANTAPEPAPDVVAETATALPATEGEITFISPEDAESFYAATGVWLRAPRLAVTPEAEDLTTLSLSAMDMPLDGRDGVGLPATAPDAGLVAQLNPPPAGTRLPRDERGFILATPEGTITPSGLVIFAGSPAVLPPTRPGTVAPEPPATPEAAETAAAPSGLPGQPMTAPPATRPQARTEAVTAAAAEALPNAPDAAAVPADAEQTAIAADATATAPGGVALVGLRPEARPTTVAAAAPLPAFDGPRPAVRPEGLAPAVEETPPPAPEADPEAVLAQTLASIVEGAGDPLATATAQAVAVARRPDSRPQNFSRVVQQQTERLARATAAAQEQSAPASLGTPEEAAETQAQEVEVAAAAPTGNTPLSVSEAATSENAMALREINLIGVYGTPNDRRALVRLDNGRYVRVSVGDSLDGGQVAAITDNTLNYVRRGRTITLQIPGD